MDPLGEIINERKRQDEKWGEQNHPLLKWIAVLGEEYGEVCKAAIEEDFVSYRRELIHVAATALAAAEAYDRSMKRLNERWAP